MNTAVVTVKLPLNIKSEAQSLAKTLGLSLSALIHACLRQVIHSRKITLTAKEEIPTPYLLKTLKQSLQDQEAGRMKTFNIPEKAVKYLDRFIYNG